MYHKGKYYERFFNSGELEDGRTFSIEWKCVSVPPTFDDPGESETYDEEFFIDGVAVEERDLPEECRELLPKLRDTAEFDIHFDPWDEG